MLFHNLPLLMDNYTKDINMPVSKKRPVPHCPPRRAMVIYAFAVLHIETSECGFIFLTGRK
jgi:hypothetical protein